MQDLPDFTLQDAPGHSSSSDEDLPDVSKTNGPGRFATQDVTADNGFGRGQRLRKALSTSFHKAAARMWAVVHRRQGLNEDLIDSDKIPTYLRLFLHEKRSSKPGDNDIFDYKVRFQLCAKCCNLTLTYTPIAPRHSRLEKALSTSFPR